MHDLGRGTFVAHANVTLAEFLQDEWLPSLEIGSLRRTTLASHRSHVRNHLAPTKLGGVRLQQLRREQIAKHYAWLLAEGRCDGESKPMSASALRRIHATLHREASGRVAAAPPSRVLSSSLGPSGRPVPRRPPAHAGAVAGASARCLPAGRASRPSGVMARKGRGFPQLPAPPLS